MHDRDEQILDPDSTSAVLSGLLPNTKYRVHIYALTAVGRGEGPFIEVETTMKAGTVNCVYSELCSNKFFVIKNIFYVLSLFLYQ